MTNRKSEVIPEAAVEAALEAFYSKCDVDFDGLHAVKAALEAAAPHMPAPRTYSLEDVAAEFGIDLHELRNAAD